MSSGDILGKKEALLGAYDGPSWKAKVAKMSDQQIIAVYLRFKNANKI